MSAQVHAAPIARNHAGRSGPAGKSFASLPLPVQDALRSPGRELGAETRDFMEPRFGHDFSKVRIHADSAAVAATQAVNARACTFGADILFAANEYAPATPQGRELLAHELAHTIQQRDPGAASPAPEANGEIESGARAAGRNIAAGKHVSAKLPACGFGLSCSPKDDDEAKRRAAAIAEAQAVAAQIDQTENEEDETPVTPMAIGGVPYNPKPAAKVSKKAKHPKSDTPSRFLPGGFTDDDIYGDLDKKNKQEEAERQAAQQKEDEDRPIRFMALRERLRHGMAKSVLASVLETLPMRDLQILKRYGLEWSRRGPDQDSLVKALDQWANSSEPNRPDAKQYSGILQSEKKYYQRNYANYRNYQQKADEIASSGPGSLTGRVVGTVLEKEFGVKNGAEWGALVGGVGDKLMPVIVSAIGPSGGGGPDFIPEDTPAAITGTPPEAIDLVETQPDQPAGDATLPDYGRSGPLDDTQPDWAFEKTAPGSPPRNDTKDSIPPAGGGGGGGGGRPAPRQTIPGNPPPPPRRPPPPPPVIEWFPRQDATPMGPEEVMEVLEIDYTRVIWNMHKGENMSEWTLAGGKGLPPLAYTVGNKVRVDYWRWKEMGLPEPTY